MPKKTIIGRDNQAYCMNAKDGDCNMANLIVGAITRFHDQELAEASNRINQILCEVREHNEDPGRQLIFLGIANAGVLLAWAKPALDVESSQALLIKTFAVVQSED